MDKNVSKLWWVISSALLGAMSVSHQILVLLQLILFYDMVTLKCETAQIRAFFSYLFMDTIYGYRMYVLQMCCVWRNVRTDFASKTYQFHQVMQLSYSICAISSLTCAT